MAEISRVALFGKLNSLCDRAIESSTAFCKLRGNPYVEMVHWLHQILQLQDSDLSRIIKHYELDTAMLARDLTAALDRLRRGSKAVTDLSSQLEDSVERAWVAKALREPLLKIFPPALLGRLDAIPYYPLSDGMLGQIVKLQLDRLKKRIEVKYKIPFHYSAEVVELVVSRCTESESGGRMIDSILANTMLPDLSRELLARLINGRMMKSASVNVEAKEQT